MAPRKLTGTRERIASGNGWTLVWKTGEELTLFRDRPRPGNEP